MNGISCLILKPLSPIYINPITRNKPNIIPCLHLKSISPLLANTRHRVYSSSADHKDVTGSRSEIPKVSRRRTSVPYRLLGAAVALNVNGLALLMSSPEGILKSCGRLLTYSLRLTVVCVAATFLARFMFGFVVANGIFSIGDNIQVGSVKGQVIEMDLFYTTILLDIRTRARTFVPNDCFLSKAFVNNSRAAWFPMEYTIDVKVDEIEKITKVVEEIVDMMKSYSNVYLEEKQPYCYISGTEGDCVELTFGCNLKPMCEDELNEATLYVIDQCYNISNKHCRATHG